MNLRNEIALFLFNVKEIREWIENKQYQVVLDKKIDSQTTLYATIVLLIYYQLNIWCLQFFEKFFETQVIEFILIVTVLYMGIYILSRRLHYTQRRQHIIYFWLFGGILLALGVLLQFEFNMIQLLYIWRDLIYKMFYLILFLAFIPIDDKNTKYGKIKKPGVYIQGIFIFSIQSLAEKVRKKGLMKSIVISFVSLYASTYELSHRVSLRKYIMYTVQAICVLLLIGGLRQEGSQMVYFVYGEYLVGALTLLFLMIRTLQRLHDAYYSVLWIFVLLIPILNVIAVYMLYFSLSWDYDPDRETIWRGYV